MFYKNITELDINLTFISCKLKSEKRTQSIPISENYLVLPSRPDNQRHLPCFENLLMSKHVYFFNPCKSTKANRDQRLFVQRNVIWRYKKVVLRGHRTKTGLAYFFRLPNLGSLSKGRIFISSRPMANRQRSCGSTMYKRERCSTINLFHHYTTIMV